MNWFCKCGHVESDHCYICYENDGTLKTECNVLLSKDGIFCGCFKFDLDNLSYLEQIYDQRNKLNV